ncbi:MAG: protein translocase subunit SecF [Clostridia bacterium]|nr:protein translocase subunit SecF [Clostridia bacterium]
MKNFHFIKKKKVTLIILAAVLVIGLASFFIRGFNIDIDFSGGTEMKIDLGVEVTDDVCDNINSIIEKEIGEKYVSSTTKADADKNMAIIRTGTAELSNEQSAKLKAAILAAYPNADLKNLEEESIAPTIGKELTKTAIFSVAIAVVLMLVYIWFRFELASGIAAVACLAHDLFVMWAIYSLFQIPINSNIIAAMLTILGYSINATIIVFDRIRENKKNDKTNAEFGEIVNTGIHNTLGRSINTTLTTLFTIGMIYILGVDSIKDFAFPLIVGIIAGLFSSVFVSGMLWDMLVKILPKKKAKKAKIKK